MTNKLKSELANALEIEPENIMEYKVREDGTYNVIDFSYRKFICVVPVPAEESKVPEESRKIYQKPQLGSKAGLLKLCKVLEIEPPEKATKKDLVDLINAYREQAEG